MRILILSQWFQPEPVFKGMPLAKALRAKGYVVEVLTGFPNYPGGRVYPGYRLRPWQRESMEGIKVNRVALYPSHDRSGFRRTLNYLSFGLNSATIGSLMIEKPDIVYAFNLVTLGLTTSLLKLRFRCPIVYDISDLWPDSVADSGMMNIAFLLKELNRWTEFVYNSAARLIVASPGMKRELVRRGVDGSRISVVYNWCNEEHMKPAPRDSDMARQMGLQGCFVAMFAGTMGVMQGLDVLLDAAARLKEAAPDVRIVLVGGGIESRRLRRAAEDRRLSNVVFIENQPPENMSRILAMADVALVHLKDSPLLRIAIPSKIQAYMAAGKPVIAAIRGDAESVINNSKAGRVVPPERPEALAEAILELYRMPASERREMGRRGLEYYRSRMSMKVGIDAIEKVFLDCVDEKRKPSSSWQICPMSSFYYRAGKRVLDIAVSVGILILLSPFLLIIALAVRSTMGKGVLFRQNRPGLGRNTFIINKFRTMRESRDKNGELAPDHVRLTGFGEFLRRTSLDELPELINVLKGDMSLVGPRPLLMEYLGRYTPVQARRMEVKPGITGWAQVNGRNAIDWETKFKYDVWYVDHLTFGLDMRILGLTLMKVFNKEGISYEGHATMPGFKGTGS